jgi:metal-responsive CopG/Arc/MetJ family transcriptional regulator
MLYTMAKSDDTEYGSQQISLRVSDKLLDALERMGDRFGVKRSQMIVRAIEEYVMRHEHEYTNQKQKQ